MAAKQTSDPLIHGVKPYKSKKGETYMGKGQIEHFRAILTAWRTELSSDTSKTVGHMQDETANHPDPTDRRVNFQGHFIALRRAFWYKTAPENLPGGLRGNRVFVIIMRTRQAVL